MNTITQTPPAKIQPAPRNIKPLTKAQKSLIGRLLVEVLQGTLTDGTRKEICALDDSYLPRPFHHLVGFVQGSRVSNEQTAFELSKDVYYFVKKVHDNYLEKEKKKP